MISIPKPTPTRAVPFAAVATLLIGSMAYGSLTILAAIPSMVAMVAGFMCPWHPRRIAEWFAVVALAAAVTTIATGLATTGATMVVLGTPAMDADLLPNALWTWMFGGALTSFVVGKALSYIVGNPTGAGRLVATGAILGSICVHQLAVTAFVTQPAGAIMGRMDTARTVVGIMEDARLQAGRIDPRPSDKMVSDFVLVRTMFGSLDEVDAGVPKTLEDYLRMNRDDGKATN